MGKMKIKCANCGQYFFWGQGEQKYFQERKLEPPKRCARCRQQRKNGGQRQYQHSNAMKFQRDVQNRVRHPNFLPLSELVLVSGIVIGLLVLVITFFISAWITGITPTGITTAGFFALNIVTIIIYRYDKWSAEQDLSRVPELVLLGLALIGGSIGAFIGMYSFKRTHKTQKPEFIWPYWMIVIFQLGLVYGYFNGWFE